MIPLRPHQSRAVKFMLEHNKAGLFLDPGLGKTRTVLEFLAFMKLKHGKVRADILGPKKVIESVWPAEIKKWGFDLSWRNVSNKWSSLFEFDISLCTYDCFYQLANSSSNILILDESSYIKNPNTNRFKYLKGGTTYRRGAKVVNPRLLSKYPYRYILTGSPCSNGLVNLWSQIYILDEGEALGKFISHYRTKYFHQKPFSPFKYYLNSGADKEITSKIEHLVLRMSGEIYSDRLPIYYNDIPVTMPGTKQAQYRALEQDFILELSQGLITSANAAVATSKLRQFAGGQVYDSRSLPVHIHDAKINALMALLQEMQGTPAIVFFQFTHEYDAICKALGYEPNELSGRTKDLLGIVERWNAGEIPVLCAHPASAAHGLNLQDGGHVCIWFSLPWSLEQYAQGIQRIWRTGQNYPVTVHRLLTEGTIDYKMCEVLTGKNKLQQGVLSRLESFSEAVLETYKG